MNLNILKKNDVRRFYKAPFSYEGGYIFDGTGQVMADDHTKTALRITGWHNNDRNEMQDILGRHIAAALTEYWESD